MRSPSPALRRRSQSGGAALIILALVALVILGAGIWYFLKGRGAGPESITQAATRMAPQNTQILIAADLARAGMATETQRKVLEALFKSQPFQELNQELKDNTGLTLEQDFATWIDSAGALIVAPKEGQTSLGQAVAQAEPGSDLPPFRMLFVLKVRDEKQAEASLKKLQEKAAEEGTKYKEEAVEGVTVHLPEKPGEAPAWALHKGYLLAGVTAEDVQMGLAPKSPSLADSDRFKKAVASLKKTDGLLGYVDLQGIIEGAPLDQMGAPDAEKLLKSLRFAAFGGGQEGNTARTEWILSLDPAEAGPLAEQIFNPSHNIQFKSVDYYGSDVDAYLAVNLRSIYDTVYAAMGTFPQGAMYRDMPSMALSQKGINFKTDVLETLSGEIAYSAKDMGKLQAVQFSNLSGGSPDETMQKIQELPFLVTVGITSKEALQKVLDKVGVGEMMNQLPSKDVNGTSVKSQGPVSFAITSDAVLVAVNNPDALEKALTDKGKGLATSPGLKQVLDALGSEGKAVFVNYQDMAKVYSEAAKEMPDQKEMAEVMTLLSQAYGKAWSAAALRKDGMYGVGFVELNPKPAAGSK